MQYSMQLIVNLLFVETTLQLLLNMPIGNKESACMQKRKKQPLLDFVMQVFVLHID